MPTNSISQEVLDDVAELVNKPFTSLGSVEGIIDLFEHALDADSLTAAERARLLLTFEYSACRDIALIQWARGRDAGADAFKYQLMFATTGSFDGADATIAGIGPLPDLDRLYKAARLTALLADSAPEHKRVAPLTQAAWIHWALGEEASSAEFVDAALDINGEYSMAILIRRMLEAEILPGWIVSDV